MDIRELSQSYREPQIEPSDECWTILQDYGPRGGGWGPAAVAIPGFGVEPHPFVYTGVSDEAIAMLHDLTRSVALETGRPTRLVRFTRREDVLAVGGRS